MLTDAQRAHYHEQRWLSIHGVIDDELIRGEHARWARHDPRPYLMPPTGPYRSIFAFQQRED